MNQIEDRKKLCEQIHAIFGNADRERVAEIASNFRQWGEENYEPERDRG